jgi:hypothetical protein
MPRTRFDPTQHGFRFGNRFVNEFTLWPMRLTAHGRCGGMAYAALDYFLSGREAPTQTELPADDSPLGRLIQKRQIDSLRNQAPGFLNRILNPFGWRSRRLFAQGLFQGRQFDLLKEWIDDGRPAALGLIGTRLGVINTHHQVVAAGYELGDRPQELRIFLYDPNYPGTELTMRPAAEEGCFRTSFPDGSAGPTWLTYFVDHRYRRQRVR